MNEEIWLSNPCKDVRCVDVLWQTHSSNTLLMNILNQISVTIKLLFCDQSDQIHLFYNNLHRINRMGTTMKLKPPNILNQSI